MRRVLSAGAIIVSLSWFSCTDSGEPVRAGGDRVDTDAELFRMVTQEQPFGSYALFPLADSVVSGTLNGSNAHQPLVRVSLNATALSRLQSGRLPAGAVFPDGSIIFKEIRVQGQTTLYAIAYKDPSNPLSAGGWLWAEVYADGRVLYSIEKKGAGCIGCHSIEQGSAHDRIRTFERQIPASP